VLPPQSASQKMLSQIECPITSFDDTRWSWHNGSPNDFGGSAVIKDSELEVVPVAGRDYWARTFYKPLLVKDDAQMFVTNVARGFEVTISTSFTLRPRAQFDQAGIMIRVSSNVWVKAGIEYSDGKPRLSCVVTNEGFSDWSTQVWPHIINGETSIKIRLSKMLPGKEQGQCIVMEASEINKDEWTQVRIASLRSGDGDWQMGLFANSPIENKGGSVTFHDVFIGPLISPVHSTDPGV
jgi:regulation of enolase protein 1 (concanavalin A-like superfamily)